MASQRTDGKGPEHNEQPMVTGTLLSRAAAGVSICLRRYQKPEMLFLSRSLAWESQCTLEIKKHKARTQYQAPQTDSYQQEGGYSKTLARGWPLGTLEHIQASPRVALAVILSEAMAVRKSPQT